MPQASDELRDEMRKRFGSIDSEGPENFLRKRGWVLNNETWLWSHPAQSIHTCDRDAFDCIRFLIHEWDYGNQYT